LLLGTYSFGLAAPASRQRFLHLVCAELFQTILFTHG
jgi:hypothetical protein